MRAPLFGSLLALGACGWVDEQRAEAAAAAELATLMQIERVLQEAIERADRSADAADRILSPRPVSTPAEEEALRRFQNGAHLASARTLGTRITSEQVMDSLVAAGQLVLLEDSTQYWIVRRGASPAYVLPDLRELLTVLGQRFQERLAAFELPPYRLEITSAQRTAERQAELRETNANAAAGVSSHEFGATVDVSYAAFAPPAVHPDEILAEVPPELRPHMERLVDLAFESVSARKSRELGQIFGRLLDQAQVEGIALVLYERQQTVYHLTVGRRLIPR